MLTKISSLKAVDWLFIVLFDAFVFWLGTQYGRS